MKHLIKNGSVIDPAGDALSRMDLLIENGKIALLEQGLDVEADRTIDAAGLMVAPGLVDMTSGSSLEGGGSLLQNHLYLMTVADRGIRANSGATLLVRGGYTIS